MFMAGHFIVGIGPCAIVTLPPAGSTFFTVPAPLCVLPSDFLSLPMSIPFMSMPPMPWARLKGIIATDRARTADRTTRRFISFLLSGLMRDCFSNARQRRGSGAGPAQQQVSDGDDEHGKQGRRDHSAHHGRGDP